MQNWSARGARKKGCSVNAAISQCRQARRAALPWPAQENAAGRAAEGQRHQRAFAAGADNPSPGVSQFHARQFRTRQCEKGGSRVIFPAANSAFGRAHRHRKCGKSRELHAALPSPLFFNKWKEVLITLNCIFIFTVINVCRF